METSEGDVTNPPFRSQHLFSDLWYFMLKKPETSTQIPFRTNEQRINYNQRILQRFGIETSQFSVLNIHQIGVNVPVHYMFEELLRWNGDSTVWPNHLAQVDRVDDQLDHIRILLLGKKNSIPFLSWFLDKTGLNPLFILKAIRFKHLPDNFDFDNARYLLYDCSGGYPIGFFGLYVRSPIGEMGEVKPTQLFSVVGFNFYGKRSFDRLKLMHHMWEGIHNRVTTHVLYRMKQIGEWRFQQLKDS